jgi:hypothetical protein
VLKREVLTTVELKVETLKIYVRFLLYLYAVASYKNTHCRICEPVLELNFSADQVKRC